MCFVGSCRSLQRATKTKGAETYLGFGALGLWGFWTPLAWRFLGFYGFSFCRGCLFFSLFFGGGGLFSSTGYKL